MSCRWMLLTFLLLSIKLTWMRCIHDNIVLAATSFTTTYNSYQKEILSRTRRDVNSLSRSRTDQPLDSESDESSNYWTIDLDTDSETDLLDSENESVESLNNTAVLTEIELCTISANSSKDLCMSSRNGTEKQYEGLANQTAEGSKNEAEAEEVYRPLRIHIHHSPSMSLSDDVEEMVMVAVEKAVQKIHSVLSVIPVPSPLLLPRSDACQVRFKIGINAGKCTRLTKGYRRELCFGIFPIPDIHLEGISLYKGIHPDPIREVHTAGPGVNDTDIVLYIVSIATRYCVSKVQSVLAYASHCRVDKTGRPVAGLINFCPFTLMRSSLRPQFLYTTALHEILHVLGFSTKLFETFKGCKVGACTSVKSRLGLVEGQYRLVTPAVVNATKQHFGCYTELGFGAPLVTKNSQETSHWDTHAMYSSLMTAKRDNTSHSVLDPITLAVFEDSGWYKVNYSNADLFLWGKDAGCSFTRPEHCLQDKQYFCSHNSSGCHFLLQDKAVCEAVKTGSQCGVYIPTAQGSCTQTDTEPASQGGNLEVFSTSSRCFLSSLTSQAQPTKFVGQCYSRRCSENGTLFLRLKGTDWIPCPAGEMIQISGWSGGVVCPNSTDIVCMEDTTGQITQQTVHTSTQLQDSTIMVTEATMRIQTDPLHPATATSDVSRESSGIFKPSCWTCLPMETLMFLLSHLFFQSVVRLNFI